MGPVSDGKSQAVDATGEETSETKTRLLRAGEHLFARQGIHRVRVRDINELAGQRNASALHYHFGSREGLVTAILARHVANVDGDIERGLDELEAQGGDLSVRDVIEPVLRSMGTKLETESGRDFLRIVPQILDQLSENLRRGLPFPATRQSRRLLALLDRLMEPLPEAIRRERLIGYIVMLTSIFAERAHHIESKRSGPLDSEQFVTNLLDMIVAALTAPSSVTLT